MVKDNTNSNGNSSENKNEDIKTLLIKYDWKNLDAEAKKKIITEFFGNNVDKINLDVLKEILSLLDNEEDKISVIDFCIGKFEGDYKSFFSQLLNAGLLPDDFKNIFFAKNLKNIAECYGVTVHQLRQIPPSTEFTSSKTILEIVKSGLIKFEELPLVTNENKYEVQEQQEALCYVVYSCFDLARELSFKDINENDPVTYPEFLKSLIRSTAKKGPNSWIEIYKYLLFSSADTAKAVDDYIKTVFLPHYLKDKKNYDIEEMFDEFRPDAITTFFNEVPIDSIYKLADRWSQPGKRAQLNNAKTFAVGQWEPLFPEPFPTYDMDGIRIIVTPLTNSQQLIEEGNALNLSVQRAIYSQACLQGRSHILSLRDELGEPYSTIQLGVGKGKALPSAVFEDKNENYYLIQEQHETLNKNVPNEALKKIAESFFKDLRDKNIKINFSELKKTRDNWNKTLKDPQKKLIRFIGYDHNDAAAVARATLIYRRDGLDNGVREVEHETKTENKENDSRKKSKTISISKQLTRNFDILTGRTKKLETKEQDELSPAIFHAAVPEIDRKTCMAIKNHILQICQSEQQDFSKNNVNVISENSKLYIKISAKSLGSESLTNLANILEIGYTIKTYEKDDVTTKLATFSLDVKNLPQFMELLKEKAPLTVKEKNKTLTKATANKLQHGMENKKNGRN